nr:PAS domain S-box protein [Chitinispirillaceae bacterium]
MATDIIPNVSGKTQAVILVSEGRSEHWLSWVRLCCALVLSLALFPGWVGCYISSVSLFLQAGAVAVLTGLSIFYLILTKMRSRIEKHFVYLISFSDVAVITAIACSTIFECPRQGDVSRVAFLGYFIAIAFTAFHHRPLLAVTTGIASIIGFSGFAWVQFQLQPDLHQSIYVYSGKVIMLLFSAVLGAMVARNNFQTVRKVLSSQLRYDTLVERLPEMVFSMDSKGNFLWSNQACGALLGVMPKKLVGMNLSAFCSKPEVLRLEQGTLKGTMELHNVRGENKFVDYTIQKVMRGISEKTFEGLMADVTDRELAISQREEMINRLFQYQKMESLGSLASGMAHDFNNILQTIIDLSTMVSRESAEPETRRRMELLLETTSDARFLTSELLALGRKKLLDYRHVDLKSFLSPLIAQFGNQFGEKYSLKLDIPDEPMKIQGDPDYLKRVFQNLFGNARDAMPDGGSIVVSCAALKGDTEKAGTIIIRVSDSG